jgi:hypothetical protein
MKSRSSSVLILIAALCLGAGAVLYLGARPAGSAYLLPDNWLGLFALPGLSGAPGQSLPSLLHALAFSLLLGVCLRPWRFAAAAACGFWLLVDSLFELAQLPQFSAPLREQLPAFFSHWPVLDHVGSYLANGRFDSLDLLLTAGGCGLAYLLLQGGPKGFAWITAWRTLAIGTAVTVGLVAIVGSTVVATNGDLNRPRPPEPEPEDQPPTSTSAGPDQVVFPGALLQLQGSGEDAEGPIATYQWTQAAGPTVQLQTAADPDPVLIAPLVGTTTELQFELLVRDSLGQTGPAGTDTVSVFVSPIAAGLVPLDFETRADGSLPEALAPVADDYASECLRFENFAAGDSSQGPVYRRDTPTNTVVSDQDRLFNPPPGAPFNVTVEFLVPVTRLSADVFSPPGTRVTLTAFAQNGTALAEVTSLPAVACCSEKTQTLAVADAGDIYRARFQTSAPDEAAPAIDNLRFERSLACLP